MVCNSCGRNNQNQNANFCEYCGASFREGEVHKPEATSTYNYSFKDESVEASAPTDQAIPAQAIEINENKKPVSFLNWLGTYAIMLIPFVGGIVFFIMLIIWSVGYNVPESKKNWARATLVYMGIMIMIALIVVLMVLSAVKNPIFQEIFQDSFNSEMERFNDIFNDFSY